MGLVVLTLGRDELSYSIESSGKLFYTLSSEVLTYISHIAAEGATPKVHTFRYHRANLGQSRYPPMPSYIPSMGGSSLSLECILLSRRETKRMEPGWASALEPYLLATTHAQQTTCASDSKRYNHFENNAQNATAIPGGFYLDPLRIFCLACLSLPCIIVLTACDYYYLERYSAFLRVLLHTTNLVHFHAPIAVQGSRKTAHILGGYVFVYAAVFRFLSCRPDRSAPTFEQFTYLQVSV